MKSVIAKFVKKGLTEKECQDLRKQVLEEISKLGELRFEALVVGRRHASDEVGFVEAVKVVDEDAERVRGAFVTALAIFTDVTVDRIYVE